MKLVGGLAVFLLASVFVPQVQAKNKPESNFGIYVSGSGCLRVAQAIPGSDIEKIQNWPLNNASEPVRINFNWPASEVYLVFLDETGGVMILQDSPANLTKIFNKSAPLQMKGGSCADLDTSDPGDDLRPYKDA